jgi:predicted transcriptional regulator
MISVSEAMAIIRRHQAEGLPIMMVPLANELGIEVYRVPNWPDDLSGMITRSESTLSGFEIYVNAGHSETRRRFTIAHECAHAILHPDLIGDGITDDALYRSGLSNLVEVQANRLAADILMPRERIDERVRAGVSSVQQLAREFNVSEQAMAIRLGVPQGL